MKFALTVFLSVFLLTSSQAQLNPCVADTFFHIVVLGSSTAAGAGASPSDSAWVNRYRDYLQSLNPGYMVTNRAQGGYNTYKLMPTGYTPPSGRPDPDTVKNITYAIDLNPDAIIVNLPSNDVASGFTVAEQLANFDTMVAHANNAGIRIWICTTQPRDFGNPAQIQMQLDVRDSIWAKYSPFVLDFWTGVPDNTNQLVNSPYNSGDGVHLNNAGHGLLFGRARDWDIPGFLITPPPYPDWTVRLVEPINVQPCGDAATEVLVTFHNRGTDTLLPTPLWLEVEHLSTGLSTVYTDTFTGVLGSCNSETVSFFVSTLEGGNYGLRAWAGPGDVQPQNDTMTTTLSVIGTPTAIAINDTGCVGDILNLEVAVDAGDSVHWYDAPTGGNLVATGNTFTTPTLSAPTSWYAEAMRGTYQYSENLTGGTSSNINFNGTMFDLAADSTLIIDSLGVKVVTTGSQQIGVYTRPGSHLGYETSSAGWTYLGAFSAVVSDPNAETVFPVGGITMNATDSLAVYIQLIDPAANLAYQSMGTPAVRQTSELQMISGSGSAHNFGGNYYPRDWNGTVHYHFGSKPYADCQSGRIEVQAEVSAPTVNLGPDTILNVTDSIQIQAGNGFVDYQWSTGESGDHIWLSGEQLGTGIYTVTVLVTDANGCTAEDEIIVVFAPLVGVEEVNGLAMVGLYPNPAKDVISVSGTWQHYRLFDSSGREIKNGSLVQSQLSVADLAPGVYFLSVENEQGKGTARFVKR